MARSNGSVQHSTQRDLDSSSDKRFDDLDIRYPVCWKFLRREDSQLCHCNRRFKFHAEAEATIKDQRKKGKKLEKITNEKWDQNSHTRPEREGAHGRLINDTLYARFDSTTELETIKELLLYAWQCPKPKLIVSIIGGTQDFTLNDRLETNFINAIMNVIIRTDIWIITNGYNNGLIQLMGHALRKAKLKESGHEVVAIAICKWGGVKNLQRIIKPKKKESIQQRKSHTSDTSDDDDDGDDNDEEVEAHKNVEYELNTDHTHYLMLDDAKYRFIHTGNYRTRLCSRIAELDREENIYTPAVTVVADGGDATISNIYYDLKANIPVVIIHGTGRVADFFSRWLVYTKDIKSFNRKSKDDEIYEIDELLNEKEMESNKTPVKPVPDPETSKGSDGRTTIKVNLHESSIDINRKALSTLFSKYKKQLEEDIEKTLTCDDDLDVKKYQKKKDSTDEIQILCEQVMYCLQPAVRSNITVFNLNSDNDLSETIFRSISKAYHKLLNKKKNESPDKSDAAKFDSKRNEEAERDLLLQLAMDWDCIDVAKEFVFENSIANITNVDKVFKDALKRNLFTFVYEFIKLGVDPATIFFPGNTFFEGPFRYEQFIKDLYNKDEKVKYKDDDFKHLISFVEADGIKKIDLTTALNVIFINLIGDYMYKLYFDSYDEEYKDRIEDGLTKKSNEEGSNKPRELEKADSLTSEQKYQMPHDYIMRDLFLWSILMNRVDMAKVLLSHMKYRICPALIATKIFKQYYRKAPYGDLKNSYDEHATYFEQYAIDCLNKCDENDGAKACEIILQRNELYGYVTCLQVAADAQDESFIATPCCVEAMNNIWYDKIHPDQTRKRDKLSLFTGFISIGLLAPIFVSYRESQKAIVGETLEPTLRSCGINYCDSYALEYPRYFKPNLDLDRYIHKLKNFHQSLLIKFLYQFATYCFFLLLFSYVLLFNFSPPTDQIPSIHWTEILTIILVSCMLIKEIRYFCSQDSLTFYGKLKSYFRDVFKSMTLIAFILFYVGLIVRFTNGSSEEDFIAARVVMAIDIELWWLRSLSFIIVIEFLGPYLVAIVEMLKDLLFFIIIIAVVMIAYGVASRSMVYYPIANNFTTATGGFIDTSFDGRSIFRQVLAPVYFFLHGELNGELNNLDSNPNAGWSIATQVLLAFHMLFVNILLVTLLIAMFSRRFDTVYDDAKNIWHSQEYMYTREYYARAPLFPPISLVYDVWYLCRLLIFHIRHNYFGKSADFNVKVFKIIPKDGKRIKEWYEFEGASTYEYAHGEAKAPKTALKKSLSGQDSSSAEIKEAVIDNKKDSNDVLESLKQVKEHVQRLSTTIGGMNEASKKGKGSKESKKSLETPS